MKKMAIYMSVLLAVFLATENVAHACGAHSGASKTNFGPGNKDKSSK